MSRMGWVYSEKVKDHFMNPRNILEDEDSFEADGRGVTGSLKCGDEMLVAIKVDKERGIITDCRWKTYGCASAIASSAHTDASSSSATVPISLRVRMGMDMGIDMGMAALRFQHACA